MTFVENAEDDGIQTEGVRKEIKRLKAEIKELRSAADERDQLKRERAFVQAGVPLDDKRSAYFIAGYRGEDTPDAIKAEWQATFGGQLHEGHGQEQNPQVAEELALLGRIAETTSGGSHNIPADRLAERDQKLAGLSPTDPRFDEKFNMIFDEYGGQRGSMVG